MDADTGEVVCLVCGSWGNFNTSANRRPSKVLKMRGWRKVGWTRLHLWPAVGSFRPQCWGLLVTFLHPVQVFSEREMVCPGIYLQTHEMDSTSHVCFLILPCHTYTWLRNTLDFLLRKFSSKMGYRTCTMSQDLGRQKGVIMFLPLKILDLWWLKIHFKGKFTL